MKLRVEEILQETGIEYRLIELKDKAITVDDVIAYSENDINPEEICKTIIVKSKIRFYALLIRGQDRIDFNKLRDVIGKTRIATLEEVKEFTGVYPGAVCPILVPEKVIVDKKVLELAKLNFGSGDHMFGIEIMRKDLDKVMKYSVADISIK